MVCDTSPSQYASTHQIWNSNLKEYRRYTPDRKRDGRTDGQCDYNMPPKVSLGHKNEVTLSYTVESGKFEDLGTRGFISKY